jgi:hypothetical protein
MVPWRAAVVAIVIALIVEVHALHAAPIPLLTHTTEVVSVIEYIYIYISITKQKSREKDRE